MVIPVLPERDNETSFIQLVKLENAWPELDPFIPDPDDTDFAVYGIDLRELSPLAQCLAIIRPLHWFDVRGILSRPDAAGNR